MIPAPPPDEAPILAAVTDSNDLARLKDEQAMRHVSGDGHGRHFLKWLMAMTDLHGAAPNQHREGQRSIGALVKLLCDAVDPALYAGLLAEMTAERVAAEKLRAKMMADA